MAKILRCRSCKNDQIQPFFDLGLQPLANSLLQSPAQPEDSYPLTLVWCSNCSLVQLNYTVDPKKLFSHYVWVTGTSKTTRDFAEVFAKEVISRTPSAKEGFVLDVGSNDGTFLMPFAKQGFNVLGIDPAQNIVDMANKSGIPTLRRFFGTRVAKEIKKEHGQAKIVFARNVLPHVANTQDFVQGLAHSLTEDGVLAIEVHYAGSILKGLQYDSIYHEHLCYFTLQPLQCLLNDFGLYVFDVLQGPLSGGSLIVYATKKKKRKSAAYQRLKNTEQQQQLNQIETWRNFTNKAFTHRNTLRDILQKAAKQKLYVAGYGSSARSSTLLNFCGANDTLIQTIIDQNPLKHGLFTAGTHIPIDSPENIMAKNPNFIVLLAWNFADEIIDILKKKSHYNGRILIPLPGKPRLLTI